MTLRSRLEDLVEGLPPGSSVTVPADWLRSLLEHEPPVEQRERLYTVSELAERYGRAESTVREWLAAGEFSGSFKVRGSWRVPAERVATFESARKKALGDARPPDLARWRKRRARSRRSNERQEGTRELREQSDRGPNRPC